MMNIRHLGFCAVVALLVIISSGPNDSADAAVVYSVWNVPMTDGVPGDLTLFVSGSFSIPAINSGPIPTLTSQQQQPGFVNFTVTNGGGFVRSFTAPSYFGYADGRSSVGNDYYVDLGPNENPLSLDAEYDQLFLTIVNNNEISADFSSLDLPHGFITSGLVPDVSVPEPGGLLFIMMGFVQLGLVRFCWRRR
jgi:hypothetical protein